MATSGPALAERARERAKSPDFLRMVRYVTVSGISTVVSVSFLFFFYRVIKFPDTNHPSAAWSNVLATVIATVPSYYLNRTWAWGKSGKSHLMKEVVPFWTIAFISLVLSSIAVRYAAHVGNDHFFKIHHSLQTGLILFANLATYGVLWVGKYLLFNRLLFAPHTPAIELALPGEGE